MLDFLNKSYLYRENKLNLNQKICEYKLKHYDRITVFASNIKKWMERRINSIQKRRLFSIFILWENHLSTDFFEEN
jgi:hypothetical protein